MVMIICPAGMPLGASLAAGHHRTLASATATTKMSHKRFMVGAAGR